MKDDPYGTDSLFDAEPLVGVGAREKPAAQRSVAQGNCPLCHADKTGLIRSGVHLTWRIHSYATWGGAKVPCGASGVYVCQIPEAEPYHNESGPVRCGHDRG